MEHIKKIIVSIQLNEAEIELGELVREAKNIYFKVKNACDIIDQVQSVIYNWKMYADQCEVSSVSKNKIEKVIGRKS